MSLKTWQPTKDPRIKKRGKFYWARFEKMGVVVQESLKTQSFETARRMVDERENCILLGVDWRKEKELFETAWPEFLKDKVDGNKTKVARETTHYQYVRMGERHFLPHFKDLTLGELNEEAWEKFVAEVREANPDMHLFNARKYLMGFLSWARRKGKIKEMPALFDPDAKIKAAREAAGPGKAYSQEELQHMRAEAAEIGTNFLLFVLMAQYMGMRPSEITQMAKDRILLKLGVIMLRKADTKTHKGRVVPIHPRVRPVLEQQLQETGNAPYLFPNRADRLRPMDKCGFKKHWARVLKAAGTDGRIYDMRHTFITHALKAGVNPVVVATVTGTSIEVIQKHYLHLEPEDLSREIGKVDL
jgi:integrase